jgi:hypothetical protein
MDGWVKRLHPSIEHLWKVSDIADIANVYARRPQRLGRASGRNEIPAEFGQSGGKVEETGLVGNRKQSCWHINQFVSIRVVVGRPPFPPRADTLRAPR